MKIRSYVSYGRCCLLLLCATSLLADSSGLKFGGGYTFLQQGQSHGNLAAFQASYVYQSVGKFYTGVTFKLEEGSIHSSERKKRILDIDAQERAGYTFGSLDHRWLLSLFTGLGYRYLNQKETWFGVSFSCTHNDLYVPVGLFVEGELSSRIRLGLSGQWRPQIYPALTLRPGHQWITERTLKNFLVEVPLSVKLLSSYPIYFVLTPFLDFWQEGQTLSDCKFGRPIPEQTFLFVGIDASVKFCF